MSKKFVVLIIFLVLIFVSVVFFRISPSGVTLFQNLEQSGRWLPFIIGASALIDSINPCAFSVLLLTIAFLFSIGKLRSSILKIGVSYVFGVFLVYILIGLGILEALSFFGIPRFMSRIGATILILFGLIEIINEFFPSFPIKLKIPQSTHHKMAELMKKASFFTAFLLGGFVGLCEFPCTGGPYLFVLGLLHDQATFFKGFGYLVVYNLIFVLPLVIILFIASDKILLEKVRDWKKDKTGKMRLWGGLIMVVLGIFIFVL
ncbi:MAG: cytochrome c biogenesis protein CcdA [Patescibacteria group bacterium]|nr:cytochrome c biogenesis protein CcdA [Patescibacteria group bacterium]